MPSPDLPKPEYPGFRTTVFFFEPALQANAKKAGMDGVFYDVGTRLAGKAETDAQGDFSLKLKPGRYSVLIGKDTLFYANIIDGQGYLHPVEVKKGERNRIGLRADWDAKTRTCQPSSRFHRRVGMEGSKTTATHFCLLAIRVQPLDLPSCLWPRLGFRT